MNRAVVNVASDSWTVGQQRLACKLDEMGEALRSWTNCLPDGCPPHRDRGILAGSPDSCVPYAFKAYALKSAADAGFHLLLWADACILPVKPMDELWERIERDGYWMSRQGYTNYQWTADSAYPDLFPHDYFAGAMSHDDALTNCRTINKVIPHVVATSFGLNVKHPKGRAFLDEYYRLASETRAFCGPWQNAASERVAGRNTDRAAAYCGPEDVLGHRHDQTAASVIAWRLGFELTDPPNIFSYPPEDADGNRLPLDERTILLADGRY